MAEAKQATAYRVLARKYRPTEFSELVGQDVLVRTLTNAFQTGRIAHAFLLTGVRGVGKTTTARIIARALNCVGPDGKGGPTITPCGVCENCRAIAEDRHVDVLEIDAASHNGVDDIRALTDGSRYSPATARTKVYILDEVHMLSKAAFNALLKTLEEPPAHVTFVFATTEARKLPLTILSRCQRFDLRRVEPVLLARHLANIAAKEGIGIEEGAVGLLARAADGSVRDGLSLLDQAIAVAYGPPDAGVGGQPTAGDEKGKVTEAAVQGMLGLADRGRTLDLFDALLAGDVGGALGNLRAQYDLGANPVVVLHDLLDLVHWLTRLKAVPGVADLNARTVAEQERGRAIAAKVAMPVLARAWSMLLKGLEEAGLAPDPMAAVEMVLVRLAYVADLPTPAEAIEKLSADSAARPRPAPASASSSSAGWSRGGAEAVARAEPSRPAVAHPDKLDPHDRPRPTSGPVAAVDSFDAVVRLAAERGELRLRAELINSVHLVGFEPGRLEVRLGAKAPKDLANRLAAALQAWTGRTWAIVVSNQPGAPMLAERDAALRQQRFAEARQDPAVQAVLAAFPGAEIREVRDVEKPVALPSPADLLEDPENP